MLQLKPISIKEACLIVARWHRHNRPPNGGLFAVSVEEDEVVVGVAIVARPIARGLWNGYTCEITRVCTNGTYNACSILYGACIRAAKALGYRRVYTYTLESEPGASLRAAGFMKEAVLAERGAWTSSTRHRMATDLFGNELVPSGPKIRWLWERKNGRSKVDQIEQP
jgi:hypothetical protein